MERSVYSFEDIIKLNDNDWNKAYFIFNDYQEKGILQKEKLGPEEIIYHVVGELNDFDLVYDIRFKTHSPHSEPMRKKRKRFSNMNRSERVFQS